MSRELPTELINLLSLHSSFLTALSLHYAHNGTASPVDLRELTASVSNIWQKRKVTFDDIRLCVGVLSAGPDASENPFFLSDYGRGKICLELQEQQRLQGALGALNENALQSMFMTSLDFLWRKWNETHGGQAAMSARPIAAPKRRGRPRKVDAKQASIQAFIVDETAIAKFIAQLPHAEITTCESLVAVAPLQEKGRKRLREFQDSVEHGRKGKKGKTIIPAAAIGKENEGVHNKTATSAAVPAQPKITDQFTQVRKTNLLDRILAKQNIAASLPSPPSAAELQRKAALQRSEEVLSVLGLMAASKGAGARVSFSVAALLQSLQGSVRSPISKEEAMKCVEVIAAEVAPGYVNLLKMGSICSVVVNPAMRPGDLKGRLVSLGAE